MKAKHLKHIIFNQVNLAFAQVQLLSQLLLSPNTGDLGDGF